MRVLICGSRTLANPYPVATVLEGLLARAVDVYEPLTIVEGCATGADSFACHFFDGPCEAPGGGSHLAHDYVFHKHFPADWERYGRAAGPIRNRQMLTEGRPDEVWAFVDKPLAQSRGTADMVAHALAHSIPTHIVDCSHGMKK